jgi:hypothetical protein
MCSSRTLGREEYKDKLLMVDPRNSSNSKFVNSWSDYNKHTSLPFVYQLTLQEYHEPIKNWEVKNNYDPNIPKWVNANYKKTFMYNDA